jgi:hypothetical protein
MAGGSQCAGTDRMNVGARTDLPFAEDDFRRHVAGVPDVPAPPSASCFKPVC